MSTPPDGDDDEIRPDDVLYRRFFPKGKKGGVPPVAFMLPKSAGPDPTPDRELSVHLARLTTPEEVMRDAPQGMKLLELTVHVVTEQLHLSVRRAPEPGNRAHCIIEGIDSLDLCDQLADLATVYRPPPADA